MAATSANQPSTSKGGFFGRFRSMTLNRHSPATSSKSTPTSPPPPPPPKSSVSQPTSSTRRPPKLDSMPVPPSRRKTLFGPVPTHSRDHAVDGYIPVQREQRNAALRAVGLKPAMTMSEMEREMDEKYARLVPDPSSSRSGSRGRGMERSGEVGEIDVESESQKIREAWLTRNSQDKARSTDDLITEKNPEARSTPSRSKKGNTLSPTDAHWHADEDLTLTQGPKPLPPVPITPTSEPTRKPSQKAEVHTLSTSPSSDSPPSAWNREKHIDTVTVMSESIGCGSSESTCSERDFPQTPMSPGGHVDVARVRRSSSSRSRSAGDGETEVDGEPFKPTAVKETIAENLDDPVDAGVEFGQLPQLRVEGEEVTKEPEEAKPQPRPPKTQTSPPVVERRSGIFGTRHRSNHNDHAPPVPSLTPPQPRLKRSFASLGSKLSFRPRSLLIDTSSSTLSPQSAEEKPVVSGVENATSPRPRPRPRHAQTLGSRPTAIVSPTSLTMHNRASMAIMAETIEDAEMRRLTEAAFLDF